MEVQQVQRCSFDIYIDIYIYIYIYKYPYTYTCIHLQYTSPGVGIVILKTICVIQNLQAMLLLPLSGPSNRTVDYLFIILGSFKIFWYKGSKCRGAGECTERLLWENITTTFLLEF